jgi:AcrR family transcriptional regulator
VVQVKKEVVRRRIIETADRLFEENGYIGTTMTRIAKEAGVASSTIYVYFPSKLDVAVAIFQPWLEHEVAKTAAGAREFRSPRTRLEYILRRLFCEIPAEQNNHLNVFMQALSVSSHEGAYKPSVLRGLREGILKLVSDCLPPQRVDELDMPALAHLTVMAFDGFVINALLNADPARDERIVKMMTSLLLDAGSEATSGKPDTGRSKTGRARAKTP